MKSDKSTYRMSISQADFYSIGSSVTIMWVIAVTVPVAIVLFSLKQLYGTYKFWQINTEYMRYKQLEKEYAALFTTRESYMFHISWAESRSEEIQLIENLKDDLEKLDDQIDEFENEHADFFFGKRNRYYSEAKET